MKKIILLLALAIIFVSSCKQARVDPDKEIYKVSIVSDDKYTCTIDASYVLEGTGKNNYHCYFVSGKTINAYSSTEISIVVYKSDVVVYANTGYSFSFIAR